MRLLLHPIGRVVGVAVVLASGPVVAKAQDKPAGGNPAPTNGAGNVSATPPSTVGLSYESLGRVLAARYPKEATETKDPKVPGYTLTTAYMPPGSPNHYTWTVAMQVMERSGQAPAMRIWFNCQVLPPDADAGRLRDMLDWSGGHSVSRGYFKTAPHNGGTMLSLVVEVPPDDVTEERLPRVVDALMLMAHETRHLWAGKLNEPTARAAAKPAAKPSATVADLVGMWGGKVFADDKKVGEYAVTFREGGPTGGFLLVSRANTTGEGPSMQMLSGGYSIVDGRLQLKMITKDKTDGFDVDLFDVELDGKAMTLTMKQGESLLKMLATRKPPAVLKIQLSRLE